MRQAIRWYFLITMAMTFGIVVPGLAASTQTIVSLTFDDGVSDQPLAAQIMGQFGMKGTFYIISGDLGTAGYMTISQVQALQAAGHEIAGHTISHPDLTTLTTAQAQVEVCGGRTALINMGFQPVDFAYPFGAANSAVEAIVKSCYTSGRGGWELDCTYDGCSNAESIPPVDPYWIRTPDAIVYTTTLAQIEQYVTNAESAGGGGWLPLQFHHVCDGCDGQDANGYSITAADLTSFLGWLQGRASRGTVVKTVAQVMGGASANPVATLSSISPSSATVGSPSLTLTLSGTNFISSSTVQWNGSAKSTIFVSSTTLRASITASDLSTAGAVTVSVLNPAPGGGTSNGQTFIVTSSGGTGGTFSLWSSTTTPSDGWKDPSSLEVGVRFRTDVAGFITGIRFYKGTFNTGGTHTGHLWTTGGTLLGSANFTTETASGWQTATFATPIAISNNTTYVASYFSTTGYSVDKSYFAAAAHDNAPLHGLKDGTDGINGVFTYSASSIFPTQGSSSSNYWVDVLFNVPSSSGPVLNPVPTLTTINPSSATAGGAPFTLMLSGSNFTGTSSVRWNGSARSTTFVSSTALTASILSTDLASSGTATVTVFTPAPGGGTSSSQSFTINSLPPPPPPPNPVPVLSSLTPSSTTAGGSAFTLTVHGSNFISSSTVRWNGGARATSFVSSTTLTAAILATDITTAGSAPVTIFTPTPGGGTSGAVSFAINGSTVTTPGSWTVWGTSAPPAGDGWKDPSSIEVGMRFRSDTNGYITGIRFYKWSTNTAAHSGHLWSNAGTLLGTVAFTGETASGWQTVYFSTPVAVIANTTYVASYFTTTGYAVSVNYFAVAINNAPLHAMQSGVDGLNGVYLYSATPAFPTQSTKSSNYWVDVVFNTSPTHGASTSAFQPLTLPESGGVFSDFSQVRVFPNPWRSNHPGSRHVTFDQLPLNSTVKIFTVSAHWVKTLDAAAGAVTWDLTNDSGDAAASGYYIYLITSPIGNTHGTFALIR